MVQVLVVALVVHAFVIPQLVGARDSVDVLKGISPVLVVVSFLLAAGAWVAYAFMTRVLLPETSRPSLRFCFGAVMASMGINHALPGGAATTAAVNYRLFARAGVPKNDVGPALALQATGSAVLLNLILWCALIVSIPTSGFHGVYASAAAVGAVVILLLGGATVALLRARHRLVRLAHRLARVLPRLNGVELESALEGAAAQLRSLIHDRRRMARGVGFAMANWLLDAAALWVMLAACGYWAGPVAVLVAFGLANVVGAVPLTPGGLGVAEAILIPSLVGFGAPPATAAVGVIAYRLLVFWLPIPIGVATYVAMERVLEPEWPV